jgi:heme a synthase
MRGMMTAVPGRYDAADETAPPSRAVGWWLLVCCFMVFAMAVIGAVTRLTGSGLSIVEWRPRIGAIPPLNEAEWLAVFEQYRQTPEYRLVNAGMSLGEFKYIFFWEWLHRLWGRLIGVAFAIPFIWFILRRRIPAGMTPKLLGVFAIGGIQGFVGWFMVQSGLIDRPSVSHYRLALHLGLALLIYGSMLWLALGLFRPNATAIEDGRTDSLVRFGWTALALVALTILWGAFVAGLDAGMVYNTFPLMGGRLLPPDMWHLAPAWLNLFENPGAVQFVHRALALTAAAALLVFWAGSRSLYLPRRIRLLCSALPVAVVAQLGLGISTLVLVVPIPLAAAHQAGAMAVLSLLIWTLFELRSGAAARSSTGRRSRS